VTVVAPRGAFYVLPNVQTVLGRRIGDHVVASAMELARHLLVEHDVAVVAGDDFGAPGYLRLSYATSMELLERGLDRVTAGLLAVGHAEE
jgi:aspartate aminotransferase